MSFMGCTSCRTAFVAAALCLSAAALALDPDEIALVINKQVPASRTLAEAYARQRNIPNGRIIEIDRTPGDVNSPAEEMPYNDYQPQVAKPVREFLENNLLKSALAPLLGLSGIPATRLKRRASQRSQNRQCFRN